MLEKTGFCTCCGATQKMSALRQTRVRGVPVIECLDRDACERRCKDGRLKRLIGLSVRSHTGSLFG